MPKAAVSILAGAVVADGPAELAPGEEPTVSVAQIILAFSISDADGRLNVFIETDASSPQVAATDSIGDERPASEQGPDIRVRLNQQLIHGRHVRSAVDDLDEPRYPPGQIAEARTPGACAERNRRARSRRAGCNDFRRNRALPQLTCRDHARRADVRGDVECRNARGNGVWLATRRAMPARPPRQVPRFADR